MRAHTCTCRTDKLLDETPIVEAEEGVVTRNGIQDDGSIEKQSDKL